jgi:hypothetical protein
MFDLNIPRDILRQNFPSQNLRITDFLTFELPLATNILVENNRTNISNEHPSASTNDIHSTLSSAAPSPSVVRDLLDHIRSASPPTARSVALKVVESGEIKHFPLWLITYWNELNHIIENQRCWSLADQSLRKLHLLGNATQELVDTTYQALSNLPWSGPIRGFSDQEEIIHLHKYATTGWLTTVHENQMLDLLKYDISNHGTQVIIQSTYFIQTLGQAFYHYRKNSSAGPLHDIGQSLASGVKACIGTIVNCRDTHWAAIVVDFSHRVIWHRDSLNWQMDPELKQVLEWWIREHTSASFAYKKLPITYQQDDYSCGLLAWNALSHFFLPIDHPLIDPSDVATARLRVLLRVCKQHQNQVSWL